MIYLRSPFFFLLPVGKLAPQADEYNAAAKFIEDNSLEEFAHLSKTMRRSPAVDPNSPFLPPDINEALAPTIFRGAALTDLPSRTELGLLAIPTRILGWSEDPKHPVTSAGQLHQLLKTPPPSIAKSLLT